VALHVQTRVKRKRPVPAHANKLGMKWFQVLLSTSTCAPTKRGARSQSTPRCARRRALPTTKLTARVYAAGSYTSVPVSALNERLPPGRNAESMYGYYRYECTL